MNFLTSDENLKIGDITSQFLYQLFRGSVLTKSDK